MTKSEKATNKRRFSIYKTGEKTQRKSRKRINSTCSIANLSLEELKIYFEKKALPDYHRLSMRYLVKISRVWKEICGELLYEYLQPSNLYGTTLIVEANSGLICTQAYLIEKELMQRTKDCVPGLKLDKIQFRISSFSRVKPHQEDEEKTDKPKTLQEQMTWLEKLAKQRESIEPEKVLED